MGCEFDEMTAPALADVEPARVRDAYDRLGIASWTDARLFREVATIVSRPPQGRMTSFTLHAPLEVIARYGLLPCIDPPARDLARLQMVASAAVHANGVTPVPRVRARSGFADPIDAERAFAESFRQGDPDGLESVVLQAAAQFGTARLVRLLTPAALATLTGASHSHIGLWLLLRYGLVDNGEASLLRIAARALAADPSGQLRSFDGLAPPVEGPLDRTPHEIEKEIFRKLLDPPKTGVAGPGLRRLMEAAERHGCADELFGGLIRHRLSDAQIDAGFRTVLRVCAMEMLQDDVAEAKFGWTHCLTLPQAAYGLATLQADRQRALAAALTWTTAYRTALSRIPLAADWTPAPAPALSLQEALAEGPATAAAHVWHADAREWPHVQSQLATAAAIRSDIHLVKYTRACFDMCALDPSQRRLYLSAAAYLCAVWVREVPHDRLLERLLDGRNTE